MAPSWWTKTLTRITFTGSDGTEQEFRDVQTGGQPKEDYQRPVVPFSRGTAFQSFDGSAAVLNTSTSVNDPDTCASVKNPISGGLYQRDGTRYSFDGGLLKQIRDRNANTLTLNYPADSYSVESITDAFGRTTSILYAQQDPGDTRYHDQITYQGQGGNQRYIKIYKDEVRNRLRSDQAMRTLGEMFPGIAYLNSPNQTPAYPPVVSEIVLHNGAKYQFWYDSYGEIARVVLPTGGAYEYDYDTSTSTTGSGPCNTNPCTVIVKRELRERRVYERATDTTPCKSFNTRK